MWCNEENDRRERSHAAAAAPADPEDEDEEGSVLLERAREHSHEAFKKNDDETKSKRAKTKTKTKKKKSAKKKKKKDMQPDEQNQNVLYARTMEEKEKEEDGVDNNDEDDDDDVEISSLHLNANTSPTGSTPQDEEEWALGMGVGHSFGGDDDDGQREALIATGRPGISEAHPHPHHRPHEVTRKKMKRTNARRVQPSRGHGEGGTPCYDFDHPSSMNDPAPVAVVAVTGSDHEKEDGSMDTWRVPRRRRGAVRIEHHPSSLSSSSFFLSHQDAHPTEKCHEAYDEEEEEKDPWWWTALLLSVSVAMVGFIILVLMPIVLRRVKRSYREAVTFQSDAARRRGEMQRGSSVVSSHKTASPPSSSDGSFSGSASSYHNDNPSSGFFFPHLLCSSFTTISFAHSWSSLSIFSSMVTSLCGGAGDGSEHNEAVVPSPTFLSAAAAAVSNDSSYYFSFFFFPSSSIWFSVLLLISFFLILLMALSVLVNIVYLVYKIVVLHPFFQRLCPLVFSFFFPRTRKKASTNKKQVVLKKKRVTIREPQKKDDDSDRAKDEDPTDDEKPSRFFRYFAPSALSKLHQAATLSGEGILDVLSKWSREKENWDWTRAGKGKHKPHKSPSKRSKNTKGKRTKKVKKRQNPALAANNAFSTAHRFFYSARHSAANWLSAILPRRVFTSPNSEVIKEYHRIFDNLVEDIRAKRPVSSYCDHRHRDQDKAQGEEKQKRRKTKKEEEVEKDTVCARNSRIRPETNSEERIPAPTISDFVDDEWLELDIFLHCALPDYHYVKGSFYQPSLPSTSPPRLPLNDDKEEEDQHPLFFSNNNNNNSSSNSNSSDDSFFSPSPASPSLLLLDQFSHHIEYIRPSRRHDTTTIAVRGGFFQSVHLPQQSLNAANTNSKSSFAASLGLGSLFHRGSSSSSRDYYNSSTPQQKKEEEEEEEELEQGSVASSPDDNYPYDSEEHEEQGVPPLDIDTDTSDHEHEPYNNYYSPSSSEEGVSAMSGRPSMNTDHSRRGSTTNNNASTRTSTNNAAASPRLAKPSSPITTTPSVTRRINIPPPTTLGGGNTAAAGAAAAPASPTKTRRKLAGGESPFAAARRTPPPAPLYSTGTAGGGPSSPGLLHARHPSSSAFHRIPSGDKIGNLGSSMNPPAHPLLQHGRTASNVNNASNPTNLSSAQAGSASKVQAVQVGSATGVKSRTTADAPRYMPATQPSSGVRVYHTQDGTPTAESSAPAYTGKLLTTVYQSGPAHGPGPSATSEQLYPPSSTQQQRPASNRGTTDTTTPQRDSRHLQLEIISDLRDQDYAIDDESDSHSADSSLNSSYCGSPRSPRPKSPGSRKEHHYRSSSAIEDEVPFVYNRRQEEKAVSQFFTHGSIIFEEESADREDSTRPPPAPRLSAGLGSTAPVGLPPPGPKKDTTTKIPTPTSTLPPLPDLNGDRKTRDTTIRQIIARASYLAGESPAESTGQRTSVDRDALGGAMLPNSTTTAGGSRKGRSPSVSSPVAATNEALAKAAKTSSASTLQCRSLSLYEAFFLDRSKKKWLVDDAVLAKCFEYVGLMGYEHPQLKRDRAKMQSSMWSSSASIPSPLVQVASSKPGAEAMSSNRPEDLCVDRVLRRYRLSHKPSCQAERTGVNTTFLSYEEAMRWVLAREYVIGAILLVCAASHASASAKADRPLTARRRDDHLKSNDENDNDELVPCIPPNTHPIFWVALHVHTFYPQWGDFQTFSTLWETQVRLVLTPASPSRQCTTRVIDDGLVFSSDREGGNLARVERAPDLGGTGTYQPTYLLWLEPDLNSDKRIWFRFSISGAVEGRMIRMKLLNAAPHLKLYRTNGMMPVWRDGLSQVQWTSVDQCSFRLTNQDTDGELTFSILPRNSTETIQVAFCAPYTYADLLCHLVHWHCLVQQNPSARIRFEERVLGYSPEGRKQHVLVISSPYNTTCKRTAAAAAAQRAAAGGGGTPASPLSARKSAGKQSTRRNIHIDPVSTTPMANKDEVRSPYSDFSTGKKVVLISGRVHPGEITASHGLHGLITYLLSGDPGAAQLRDHFIFLIVPMLNPDGVSRGHSRMDQYGVNLNRSYNHPDPIAEPTIYQLKKLFEGLLRTHRERFFMYIDFHSHASQSTSFMFGNHLPSAVHHWNMAFPRLVELHSQNLFSYSVCRFGKSHMSSKDGASRVLFGTSLIHSYTIELPHFTDRTMFTERLHGMISGRFGLEGGSGVGGHTGKHQPMQFSLAFLNSLGPEHAAAAALILSSRRPIASAGRHAKPVKASKQQQQSESLPVSARQSFKQIGATPCSKSGFSETSSAVDPGERRPPLSASRLPPTSARRKRPSTGTGTAAAAAAAAAAGGESPERAAPRKGKGGGGSGAATTMTSGAVVEQEQLQPIFIPSVLRQSAIVGVSCMHALLDYASLSLPCESKTGIPAPGESAVLHQFGGMGRILTVVRKRGGVVKKKKKKR